MWFMLNHIYTAITGRTQRLMGALSAQQTVAAAAAAQVQAAARAYLSCVTMAGNGPPVLLMGMRALRLIHCTLNIHR
jgi:hypothetical protein